MQTILVTGSKGQLGNELQAAAEHFPNFRYIFTDVDELDICNKSALDNFIREHRIEIIINCAAYTAVDKAEEDIEKCYAINAQAVKNIGEVAENFQLKVVHVSTDYVFDGKSFKPYTEDMCVSPDTVYGKSKLEGEKFLQAACHQYIIIRTSWLYSSYGNNFVKTMLRLGKEKDSLNVIFDQIGTPTYAADLAASILKILSQNKFISGIYHFSNEGVCSWYDFATAIFKIAQINCQVNPIETKDYPAKAPRPYYSVLNKAKIKNSFGLSIAHWEESLEKCIEILKSENSF
jgi:dTDP-4-dehydrorhamnose reductase